MRHSPQLFRWEPYDWINELPWLSFTLVDETDRRNRYIKLPSTTPLPLNGGRGEGKDPGMFLPKPHTFCSPTLIYSYFLLPKTSSGNLFSFRKKKIDSAEPF